MFIRLRERSNQKVSIQIVENRREGSQIRQKVLRTLGAVKTPREIELLKSTAQKLIEELKRSREKQLLLGLKAEPPTSFHKEPTVLIKNIREDRRVVLGVQDVLGRLYDEFGFLSILPTHSPYQEALKQVVLARIVSPESKRATSQFLNREFDIQIPIQKLYRMLDHIGPLEEKIKQLVCYNTLGLFQQKVDVLFFDVTTLYFESLIEDDLRAFGFSKDCKFKETQVVLALVTTHDGQPIRYELFPGNTYEGGALIQMITSLQKHFDIQKVLLIADRAMFNEKNLTELERLGVSYIVAAKLRALQKKLKQAILSSSEFKPAVMENEFHWIREWSPTEGRRLIVSYSRSRARKDATDRQRIIERLLKKIKTKDGNIPIGKIIRNRGTSKYIKIKGGTASFDETKIQQDAQWDGLHGVITNSSTASPSNLLSRYRGLWQIEQAFRVNKNNLRMRPIFHWTSQRIKAHIAVCFMAYALTKFALNKLKATGLSISLTEMQQELMHVQASFLSDKATFKKFLLPSQLNPKQKEIYKTLRIPYSDTVRALN